MARRGFPPYFASRRSRFRTSRSIETATLAAEDKREPPVATVDTRIGEWTDRLQELVDDEVEAGEELSAVELIAEGLGLFQDAVDKALGRLERETAGRFDPQIKGLHAKIVSLTADRAADQERHGAEVRSLRREIAQQAKDHAAEGERWRDELRTLANELAEMRALDRLRHTRAGRSHDPAMALRLARKELEREALGAAQ